MDTRSIQSGLQKGLVADLVRLLLAALALLYRFAISLRNACYDHGWIKIRKLPVPVISVGNITVGGTGKTPMTIWLCRQLQAKGKKVALLTRGYKSTDDNDNDETRLFRNTLPNVPVIIDKNRFRGGLRAISEHNPDLIIMDDGFQHRRLHRDLDIVMIDATCPFGYNALLPRGRLREPFSQVKRAHTLVITRSDMIDNDTLSSLKKNLSTLFNDGSPDMPTPPIVQCEHQPIDFYDAAGRPLSLDHLKQKNVLAFCALANPDPFLETLENLYARVVAKQFFKDHHHYTLQDCRNLLGLAEKSHADSLVTTQKDWVKINQWPQDQLKRFCWLKIEIVIIQGEQQLIRQIEGTSKNRI